ncbi:MAG: hypothetical protein KAT00_08460 [Planctomycetes bacterium]|nr:hypothetical protein [Planctomycetota bacterium]
MTNEKDIVSKATDAIKGMEIPAGPSRELMDATVARIRQEAGQSGQSVGSEGRQSVSVAGRITLWQRYGRVAAAAMILIGVGYLVGRVGGGEGLDVEELRLSILADVQEEMSQGYASVRNELGREFREDMNEYALQTLAASSASTNQMLTELIDVVGAARQADREWIVQAMTEIEQNRLDDNTMLTSGLEMLAVQTESEFVRTRMDVVELLTNVDSGGSVE